MSSIVVTGASQKPCRDMKYSRIEPILSTQFPVDITGWRGVTKCRDMKRYKINQKCENWDLTPHIQPIHSVAITNYGIREWNGVPLVIARSIAKLRQTLFHQRRTNGPTRDEPY